MTGREDLRTKGQRLHEALEDGPGDGDGAR
jgi:hypothetical protein